MAADPLGRAMLDFERGALRGECRHRDGDDVWDARIYDHYFTPPSTWREETIDLLASLDGPVLDVGCGAGKHARWLHEHGREVVAMDVSPHAARAARESGVEHALAMDMFALGVRRDAFRSALVNGTQIGLAGSLPGVRACLDDLARVTDGEGVAVVDSYDPAHLDPRSFSGYRPDPRAGVARRAFHVEYDHPDGSTEVGRSLDFVLFSPERLREVAIGTPWTVEAIHRNDPHYRAVLAKPPG